MKINALLFSLVVGIVCSIVLPAPASAQEATSTMTTTTTASVTGIATSSAPVRNVHNAADIERQVRAFFADAPVMANIARCESKFRQFADSGNVFKGGT